MIHVKNIVIVLIVSMIIIVNGIQGNAKIIFQSKKYIIMSHIFHQLVNLKNVLKKQI